MPDPEENSQQMTLSAPFTQFSAFSKEEDFEIWFERLEQWFLANNVPPEKQVAVFLSLLNSETYGLLRNLATPTKPPELTLKKAVEYLTDHYKPKPSEMSLRYSFRERIQKPSETISEFVADLKRLSIHCNFGDNLEQNLRDQLVCGLRTLSIKKRLLNETALTFAKAYELSLNMEASAKEAEKLTNGQFSATGSSRYDTVKFVDNSAGNSGPPRSSSDKNHASGYHRGHRHNGSFPNRSRYNSNGAAA